MEYTAVIDYGASNLQSVTNALTFLQIPHVVTNDMGEIDRAKSIILPGVGSFRDAMMSLGMLELPGFLKKQAEKKPLLGICLGMQLLFDRGYEMGVTVGLGLLRGEVHLIGTPFKLPQIGWNELEFERDCEIAGKSDEGGYVYFVHSYAAFPTDGSDVVAVCDYGVKIPAIVARGTVYGCQFHPEKSGLVGLGMLRRFGKL